MKNQESRDLYTEACGNGNGAGSRNCSGKDKKGSKRATDCGRDSAKDCRRETKDECDK